MRIKLVFAALAALAAVSPAAAQDCKKPLRLLASLPMTPDGHGRMNMPVTINGVEKQFLLDTGGLYTQVSAAVATELKLSLRDSPIEMIGVDGSISNKYTTVDSFGLGKIPGGRADMQITPDGGLDGIFTPLLFKSVDFDMDFAAHKLNLLSADHCEGQVIYWPAKAIAVVPFLVRDNHITVPVTVDGHTFTAIVDTGASTSNMSLTVARHAFNLSPDSPDLKIIGHVGGDEKAFIYSYAFKTLTFEGITVNNPTIHIMTDIVNKNADHTKQTGSLIKTVSDDLTLPQVIVGMDVLSRLHPYLAMGEKRLI